MPRTGGCRRSHLCPPRGEGLIRGHAADVPLPSRECKSGAGLWEVLQLEKSYDLDEHLKTPKVRAGSGQSLW